MEVQISGKAAEIINAKVASGFYADATEFITDIVLRADEFDQVKLERLRRELQIGIDQLNRGESVPLDAKRINRAIQRKLKKRIR
jgi:antitoxin ParD1/3/4